MADGVLEQDMVSFRARLDDHHLLLTNQSAGAYYLGVYNNDNYMKVRGRPTSKCFAMQQASQGKQHVDVRQACRGHVRVCLLSEQRAGAARLAFYQRRPCPHAETRGLSSHCSRGRPQAPALFLPLG